MIFADFLAREPNLRADSQSLFEIPEISMFPQGASPCSRFTMSRLDNPEIVEEICNRLICGEAVRNICNLEHMPSTSQLYTRLARDEKLSNDIARARRLQQDAAVDQMIDMADDATEEDWQVVKLRIWARQWRAAKLAPKKYGDKQQHEHTGNNVGTVIQINASMTPIEAMEAYQQTLALPVKEES